MKKIELMHSLYGKTNKPCVQCPHFVGFRFGNKNVYKCRIYGITNSEASDWRMSWCGCGLFGKETEARNIIRMVKPNKKNEQISGQIMIGGGNGESLV